MVSAEPACASVQAQSSRRERSSWGITLLGRGVLLPECADCEAASYSVKGTGVNAERGMAHGSSTFEESKSLGSSVDGIGETLRAIDFALDCRPHGP